MSKVRGRSLISLSSFTLIGLLLVASQPQLTFSAKSLSPNVVKINKAEKARYLEDEIIVRFRPGIADQQRKQVHEKLRGKALRHYKSVPGLERIRLAKGKNIKQALKEYLADPRVLYAEPNYIYHGDAAPNDPQFTNLWGLRNTGQSGGVADADINAVEAWDSGVTGNANFVIAILDSGIDYTHEDLAPNIWINPGEIPNNNIDDDGNGFVDDIHGIDAVNRDGGCRERRGPGRGRRQSRCV